MAEVLRVTDVQRNPHRALSVQAGHGVAFVAIRPETPRVDEQTRPADGDDTGLGESEPERTARRAAAAAGVEVADVDDLASMQDLCRLLDEEPGRAPGSAPMTPQQLLGLARAGDQVSVARRGDAVVGGTVAQRDDGGLLRSRRTVVRTQDAGHGVGRALKWHQRAWGLQRGIGRVRWHGDPVRRRTAVFDLVVLGARVAAYEQDLEDRGSAAPTDRVVIDWDLEAPRVVSAASGRRASPDANALRRAGAEVALSIDDDGGPLPHDTVGPRRLVRIPADVDALREHAPDRAAAWASAVRATLGRALADGARITGITRDGWYVLSDDRSVAELRTRP